MKDYTDDKRLSLKAKGILAVSGFQILYFSEILKSSKDNRDAVYSGIRELVKFGYCDKIIVRDRQGRHVETIYNFRKAI
ncbi:DNA replication protein [Elizabethkingia phage TCUEAP2]|nr:DNA replication protein [Elizabethkingia phage TCUEAP2]